MTISLGGGAIKTAQSIAAPLQRAEQVKDDRLKALYAYKANEAMKDAKAKGDLAKIGRISKNDLSLSVSFGSTSEESQSNSTSKLAQGSHVDADGNVAIQATQGNVDVKGSDITGKNIALDAKKNVNITAGENSNKTTSESHNSDAGFGVSFSTAGLTGVELHSNKQNDAVKENTTTYKASTVTAKDTLDLHSGEDTNILGSKASGDKVKVKVEGNLNLESLQDKDTYEEKSDSSGFGISSNVIHPEDGKTGGNVFDTPNYSGSVSKGNIDSDYNSVTKQAEIHAGQGGFAIEVGKNTDLKGAVISSDATADKNKISTGTLTYSDIQNKADYSAGNSGFSLQTENHAKTTNDVDASGNPIIKREKNQVITPDMSMSIKGSSASTTKSSIAAGTVEVRNGNYDLSGLSRNTADTMHALGKIFDANSVKEKQELVNLFGQESYKLIGDISLRQYEKAKKEAQQYKPDSVEYKKAMEKVKAWDEGGSKKILLHALAGGIMSNMAGNGFSAGASGAALNEAVQKELAKIKDTGVHELASMAIGAAAAKIIGADAKSAMAAALSGTKNNWLDHEMQLAMLIELEKAGHDLNNSEVRAKRAAIYAKYKALDAWNDENIPSKSFDNSIEPDLKKQMGNDMDVSDLGMTSNLDTAINAYSGEGSYELAQIAREHLDESGSFLDQISFGTVHSDLYVPRSEPSEIYSPNTHLGETVESVMANNGRMNESGQFVRSDGSVCYNLPGAGDYYASLGYHVVPGQDNVHYTITPQGTFWTTAPLTDASPLQIVTEKVENAKETLSEMAEPVLDGAAGFVTRIDDNVSFGIVQNGYEEITGHRIDDRDTLAFYKGQVAGDILSGGVGVGEIAAGSAGGSLSIAAIPESGGLSIVAVDASYGTIALGTNTLNNAKQNLQQDWLKATTRESEGSSNAKTTAELIKDVTIKDGKYYSPKATIDEIGQLEAKGVDFSKLDSKVMSSRPSTEGGTSRVVKYSDSDGTKFIVHEVTDQSGNVLHRDFDAVRIESGQLINKAEK